MIFRHSVATIAAIANSIKYGRVLGIRRGEWGRYLKKSIGLGLCYVGFGATGKSCESWRAGRAGFLCCAYDVVTDWRMFDICARSAFEGILRSMRLEPRLQELALKLYDKELLNQLEEDGLERGYIALRFTLGLMGCEKEREVDWGNVDDLGRLFQIVDDVLDYEHDIYFGEMNSLNSNRREQYLRQLTEKLSTSETQKLFGKNRSVLIIAIERARRKAQDLLKAENLLETPVQTPPTISGPPLRFDIH